MGILSRAIFWEVVTSSVLGAVLFTFVLFLQRAGKLFETLVRSAAPPLTVLHLFALAVPFTFSFTIPLGVLAGVLITLNRMSTDAEITAMRAAGVSSRRVAPPILFFATIAMLITALASLWLTPYSLWRTRKIVNRLLATELTAEVQPRIFEEQFPNKILYIGDVVPGPVARWRNIFLADLTPAEQRTNEGHDRSDEPRITVATEALAVPDVPRNLIQLSMLNENSYEVGKEVDQYYITSSPKQDQLLQATKPNEVQAKGYTELDTRPLYRAAYRDPTLTLEQRTEARLELQHRLALPPACILLAFLGIPLGISTRKGGKSTAFVLTAALAFLYYMGLIAMNGLAKQHTLPAEIAVWIPNAVFAIIGLALLVRLERPGHGDIVGAVRGWIDLALAHLRGREGSTKATRFPARPRLGFSLLAQIVDRYVLGSFLFYFLLMLSSFVLMTLVYTFFELLNDIVRNEIPMTTVLRYLFFLTPKLIYDSTPVSVLVTVLITFGILAKHNEVTAFKACGVSLYRMAAPILLAAGILSAGLFGFDHAYLPKANRIQDALRAEIKGKPAQTYLNPEKRWIFGHGSRIFYYNYLNPLDKVMSGREGLRSRSEELPHAPAHLGGKGALGTGAEYVGLRKWMGTRLDQRARAGSQLHGQDGNISRDLRAPELVSAGGQAGEADEFRGAFDLHSDAERKRRRDDCSAGPVLSQIFGSAVRLDNGRHLDPVCVPDREPGSHGGRGRQLCDRDRLLGHRFHFATARRCGAVARGGRGVGSGRSLRARRLLLFFANAHVSVCLAMVVL